MPIPIRKFKGSAIQANAVTDVKLTASLNATISGASGIKVSSISYPNGFGFANSIGDTITLIGSGFASNANVRLRRSADEIVLTSSNVVTINANALQITTNNFTETGNVAYSIYIQNSDGGSAEVYPGLLVDSFVSVIGSISGYSIGNFGSGNDIEKFPFATNQNATITGALSLSRYQTSASKSVTHGYINGGYGSPGPTFPQAQTRIDKFPFATNQDATTVGDIGIGRAQSAGHSSGVSGYVVGGISTPGPTFRDDINKYPFATNQGTTSVGILVGGTLRGGLTGISSGLHGYVSGGRIRPPTTGITGIQNIDKYPFASEAFAVYIGSLTIAKYAGAGISSFSNGYDVGGWQPPSATGLPSAQSQTSTIQRFSFATNAPAAGVAALSQSRAGVAGHNTKDFGYTSGGYVNASPQVVASIDKFPFATNQNSTTVAQLNAGRYYRSGLSF